jgi:pimeloyl-ACP methyl ester carboxylesterase
MNPSTDPGSIYVEESGVPGAPAIVFVHGMGQSGRIWRGHMERLSGFHCLAPDLPGFGRSNHLPPASLAETVDLVSELIETRVPAGRAHLVGLSWGAVVIHSLLIRHPDLIDRAVIDGAALIWPRGAGSLGLLVMTAVSPFLRTRPVMALFHDLMDAEDLRVASRRAFRRVFADSRHPLAAIGATRPTLLVAGEKESTVRPADAALTSLMPHAEAWYAPGLGHCWQRKASDLHIRMVEAWVTGQELPSELQREQAPSTEALDRLRATAPETWYLRHKSRIMREVRFASRPYRKQFVSTYGKEVGEAVATDTMRRFEALLPDIPYIGGDENPMTRTLYLSGVWLAMYRALRARGASIDEAARLIYLGTASLYDSFPFRLLLRWQGRRLFGRRHIEQRRHAAAISQRRRYPDDWVFDVVEGDGRTFEWGLDYTECAIVKYLKREGAPELAAYGCWVDYPAYAAMGVKLIRTETIAQGGQRCDFRFSRGTPVKVEPEFLHV